MNNDQLQYMTLLQGSINRYSSNSVVVKSIFIALYCAYIVALLTFKNNCVVFLSLGSIFFLVLFILSGFDLTQCRMERKCIARYENVRKGKITVDFELNPRKFSDVELKNSYVFLKMQFGLFYIIFFIIYITIALLMLFQNYEWLILSLSLMIILGFLLARFYYKKRNDGATKS